MSGHEGKSGPEGRRGAALISQRTAVVTISILLGACAAGWLMTEFFPPDFPQHREMFRQRWGEAAVSWIEALKLYDPFHSFWFSGVLALFFVVLLLCMATRWKGMFSDIFRIPVPRTPAAPGAGRPGFEIPLGDAARARKDRADPVSHYRRKLGHVAAPAAGAIDAAVEIARKAFKSKGYRFAVRREGEKAVFAAVSGRWRSAGSLIFHVGLLVITIGGVVGSRLGGSEMLYGKRGDLLPLGRDGTMLRVDDFRILMAGRGIVKDYVTTVTVVDPSGAEEGNAEIEVNHPLEHGGYSVYQSSYYPAENEFEWARILVSPADTIASVILILRPGVTESVPGTDLAVRAGRFMPDFRMTESGPRSASGAMNNPAIEILLDGPGGATSGWIFLLYPDFSTRFDRVMSIQLKDIEPAYYTGLEISWNPGAPLFMAGMILAAAGLVLLYMFDYRLVHGRIDSSALVAAGVAGRWKVVFGQQIEKIGKDIETMIEREDPA